MRVSETKDSWKAVVEPLETVISIQFSRSYKREYIPEFARVTFVLGRISQPQDVNQLASHRGREDARSPGENGTILRHTPIVSCYKWLYLSVIVTEVPINQVVLSRTLLFVKEPRTRDNITSEKSYFF
jgi:hypothetical protein